MAKKDDELQALEEIRLEIQELHKTMRELTDIFKQLKKPELESVKKNILSGAPLKKKVYALCDGKHSVQSIVTKLEKKQSHISQILSELKTAGLIKEERYGKQKYYEQRF